MSRTLKLLAFGLFHLGVFNASAQVTNEVSVYVKPGTQVYVNQNMINTNTGSYTTGSQGLLHVSGTLVNNGSMTFENSATLLRGSTSNDGTGSGTYYVRRQGSNSTSVFNFWSSPMQSYSGVPGSNQYSYDSNLGTQDYNDDQPADPGWVSYSAAMSPGVGYAGQGGGLHTFIGDVNNGNVDIPLTFYPFAPGNTAPGTPFNLVGNPYPSAISCASLVSANPDINGSIYFWDDDNSGGSGYSYADYAIWNGTGALGTGSGTAGNPNGFISTGQGFKVRALNGGAVLNFTNSMRQSNNNQFFKPNADASRLWFSIQGMDNYNQILIGLLDDATDQEDRLYDATKLRGNNQLSLSARDGDIDYAIMAFPHPSIDKVIPLSVLVAQNGPYTFKANVMENFEFEEVYFIDTQSGNQTLLEEGTEIAVYLEDGLYTDRFYLNFSPEGTVTGVGSESDQVTIYAFDNQIYFSSSQEMVNGRIELYDISGRMVFQRSNLMISKTSNSISMEGVSSGMYMVRLNFNDKFSFQKVFKK